MQSRIGVVLSGCGVFDGSEIHESVSVLIALDRRGAKITCMAPNINQPQTINHLTRKDAAPARNVLEESARIARGKIIDLASAKSDDFDALVFPGGFGAAKNLCTFAVDGPQCKVNPDVQRLLLEMHKSGKPIGLACIAPVIAARVFGQKEINVTLTIGTDAGAAGAVEKMGAQHQNTGPTDVCVDEKKRIVTTPCYMNDVGPWTVYQGADKMVERVLAMINKL